MEKIKKNLRLWLYAPADEGRGGRSSRRRGRWWTPFWQPGFNYFDTAHGYLDGRSETALKACLTSRYPREDYVLTDKLTANFFKTEADIRPLF